MIVLTCVLSSLFSNGQPIDSNPPVQPTLFAEINSEHSERDMAISPSGTEMFYTQQGNQHTYSVILRRTLKNGKWSTPGVAPFSGRYGDLEPAFSADGEKLFFSSNRPLTSTTNNVKDYDIWYVEKLNGKWSEPKHAGSMVNTPADEYYPSVAANGNLYFTAAYEKGVGREDIYVCRWEKGNFTESVALDTAVNSKTWEFNAFVSPDEQYIIFTSYGRKDDMGGGDLYICRKDANNKFMPAQHLAILNSSKIDYCPYVSVDQKRLFFTSGRHGIPKIFPATMSFNDLQALDRSQLNGLENIYTISFQKVIDSLE